MTTRRGYLIQFLLLFGFWLLLSDQYRPLFLAIGAVAAAVVTWMTHRIVATVLEEPGGFPFLWLWHLMWFVVYVVWLISRIVLASVQLAILVLHPRAPIDPGFVRVRTQLQRPLSRVILANSITLVPGTLTVRLEGDELLVHALTPASASDLANARLQNMIGRFLGEAPEPPPEMVWEGRDPLGGGAQRGGER